ncbi:MAG: hypothetical protein ATN35_12355 [Epulopiscium sp. Nele67-Bin004]|nr:MAG: hypothetical protein ATN35_12355 [Epulopiscium sp. Nele67-Bin004]
MNEHILSFATSIGELMLRSGAETYRVEDTITRILSIHNFDRIDTFVTPTMITTAITINDVTVATDMRRIVDRSTRLDKIELLNQLSRDYVSGKYSLDEARAKVKEIDATPPYPFSHILWITGVSTASFSLMFNGGLFEFCVSFAVGCLAAYVQEFLRTKKIVKYLTLFILSFMIIAIIVPISDIFDASLDAMIIGCIMILVPGVAFTNSIRDTIGDELLSGISRGVEALCIAIVLAVGVSVPMSIYMTIGGVLR